MTNPKQRKKTKSLVFNERDAKAYIHNHSRLVIQFATSVRPVQVKKSDTGNENTYVLENSKVVPVKNMHVSDLQQLEMCFWQEKKLGDDDEEVDDDDDEEAFENLTRVSFCIGTHTLLSDDDFTKDDANTFNFLDFKHLVSKKISSKLDQESNLHFKYDNFHQRAIKKENVAISHKQEHKKKIHLFLKEFFYVLQLSNQQQLINMLVCLCESRY